jgi:hypothetical protein
VRLFPRGLIPRCLGILAAVSFAATGPGLAGVEVLAHLSGIVDLTHERQPHFEEAGHTGHTDDCQLGSSSLGGRLPPLAGPALKTLPDTEHHHAAPLVLDLAGERLHSGLPRAPPA